MFVRQCSTAVCKTIVTALLLGAATLANAQTTPVVSAASGVFRHGETVTITGAGFGMKAVAAPLVWEDFADETVNPLLKPSANGTLTHTNTTDLRTPFSRYNARADYNAKGDWYDYDGGVTARKWFVQYWIKLASNWTFGTTATATAWQANKTYVGDSGQAVADSATGAYRFVCVKSGTSGASEPKWNYETDSYTDDGTTRWQCKGLLDDRRANIKLFRVVPNDNVNNQLGYVALLGSKITFNGPVIEYLDNLNPRDLFSVAAWHSVQVEYGEASGVNTADGHVRLWVDGTLRHSRDNVITNTKEAVLKYPTLLGWYDTYFAAPPQSKPIYAYYTDLYVDPDWARVEIGDAATYAACRHREIQLPTQWSSGEMKIKVNQGSFGPGTFAYLYIINSSGVMNPTGIPLQFGAGLAPLPPANVTIR